MGAGAERVSCGLMSVAVCAARWPCDGALQALASAAQCRQWCGSGESAGLGEDGSEPEGSWSRGGPLAKGPQVCRRLWVRLSGASGWAGHLLSFLPRGPLRMALEGHSCPRSELEKPSSCYA